jgi:hypothetical protein
MKEPGAPPADVASPICIRHFSVTVHLVIPPVSLVCIAVQERKLPHALADSSSSCRVSYFAKIHPDILEVVLRKSGAVCTDKHRCCSGSGDCNSSRVIPQLLQGIKGSVC